MCVCVHVCDYYCVYSTPTQGNVLEGTLNRLTRPYSTVSPSLSKMEERDSKIAGRNGGGDDDGFDCSGMEGMKGEAERSEDLQRKLHIAIYWKSIYQMNTINWGLCINRVLFCTKLLVHTRKSMQN